MNRPAILTVDDDPEVLQAIERDLRKRYSRDYRVLAANSGANALKLTRDVIQRNDTIALFLVDHRMPQMSGVEFLSQALKIVPGAKRVLLTAYADTDAAIRAINEIRLDHYLLKPWSPPDTNLYPVLDDLLSDWRASYRPAFEGLRVLGTRWSPRSFEIREFLARNHVPYRWLDVETADQDAEVRSSLDQIVPDDQRFPVVLLQDGEHLSEPGVSQLASRIGLHTQPTESFYDLVIVGGGPAGLAAAVYGASEGLKTVIVEREAPGGQAGLSSLIENYLGFPSGLSGGDLARRAVTQAKRFGADILTPQEAKHARTEGPYRILTLQDESEVSCHSLLIATGVQWRRLDVPGIDRLTGAGVYYGAASTEALWCKDEIVYIIGGANSAGQAAMNLARYASGVVMLIRGSSLSNTMSQYLIDAIEKAPNIHVRPGTQLVGVDGEEKLETISIHCSSTGLTETVPAHSVSIFIGAEPKTSWLDGFVERDDRGFVLTGSDLLHDGKRPAGWGVDRDPTLLETSVPGVFAVGDVRHGSVKRVASGVGEGSIAIQFVHQYLAKV